MTTNPSEHKGAAAQGQEEERASMMEKMDDDSSFPQIPSMREQGDNRQHMAVYLHDHSYATPPGERGERYTAEISHQSRGHQVFPNPPASPTEIMETEELAVHLQVYSEISMNYVVYGTVNTLKILLDYIDGLKRQIDQATRAKMECKEGVLVSKVLTIGYPGVYEEGKQYDTICTLGSGTFGQVFRCKDRTTGAEFACKKMTMSSFRRQEVEVVVELMDASEGAKCLPQVFGVMLDGDFVCLFMEYVDSTWHECVKDHQRHGRNVREENVIQLLKQSLLGLRHLQLHKVSHCDIKPENMGYNSRGEVKLLDFGTVRLSAEEFSHRGMTPNYMAPEVCRRQSHFNSDMWSLGCTMIYLLDKIHPWYNMDKTPKELLVRIQTHPEQIFEYLEFAHKENGYSRPLCDLLRQMLHPDPDQRVRAEDALRDSLFSVRRPTSGTLSSLGAVGEEVPTVVPQRASNPRSTELVYDRHRQSQPQGLVDRGPGYQQQGPHQQTLVVQGQPNLGHFAPGQSQQGLVVQGGGASSRQPILRKVPQAAYQMAGSVTQFPSSQFQRCGPPGNGNYPGYRREESESGLGGTEPGDSRYGDEVDSSITSHRQQQQQQEAAEAEREQTCNHTSGYHTSNTGGASIEVSYKDRVEEFRITQRQTIGQIWPQLKETALKLTKGRHTGAVAIYEGNKKVDISRFPEFIDEDKKFTLCVLNE